MRQQVARLDLFHFSSVTTVQDFCADAAERPFSVELC